MSEFAFLIQMADDAAPELEDHSPPGEQGMCLDLKVVHHASTEILALYEAPLVLIRPDQIVAWRGNNGGQAKAILAQVMGHGDTVQGHTMDAKLPQ